MYRDKHSYLALVRSNSESPCERTSSGQTSPPTWEPPLPVDSSRASNHGQRIHGARLRLHSSFAEQHSVPAVGCRHRRQLGRSVHSRADTWTVAHRCDAVLTSPDPSDLFLGQHLIASITPHLQGPFPISFPVRFPGFFFQICAFGLRVAEQQNTCWLADHLTSGWPPLHSYCSSIKHHRHHHHIPWGPS